MEFYKHVLIDELNARKARSDKYSLRAYARDLGLAPSTLSGILNNKREIPRGKVGRVAKSLDLDPIRNDAFVKSATRIKMSLRELAVKNTGHTSQEILNEQRDYNIIAKWEYYAILNLFSLKDFKNDIDWMAMRLNLKPPRVKQVVMELEERGFIVKCQKTNQLKRTDVSLTTTRDVFSQALRHSHLEGLKLASEKMGSVPIEKRFYSSTTMPIDIDKLDEAKDLVREFREKLSQLMTSKKNDEVYQFNIQLFPLSSLREMGDTQGVN